MQRGNLGMNTMTTFEASARIPEYGVYATAELAKPWDRALLERVLATR